MNPFYHKQSEQNVDKDSAGRTSDSVRVENQDPIFLINTLFSLPHSQ